MTAAEFRESAPGSPVDYVYTNVSVLHEERSAFQEIAVLEHPILGKMLILDGVVQLTEHDEFLYHEMLVHPALMTHPDPVNVLIVGGGDGGSLREVLKHETVERVTVAEIDRRVVDVSRDAPLENYPVIQGVSDLVTGATIREVAIEYGRAKAAITFWGMGMSQHVHGTDNCRSIISLCLMTGNIGRPGCGPHSQTGQPNAMGERLTGGLTGRLPFNEGLKNVKHRKWVASQWGIPEARLATPRPHQP